MQNIIQKLCFVLFLLNFFVFWLDETDDRKMEDLEDLMWNPDQGLAAREIDQFMVVARSIGTFARALDCSSSVKQPSLHMSAAAASRDITLVCDTFEDQKIDYWVQLLKS